jgi:hypothetical protein
MRCTVIGLAPGPSRYYYDIMMMIVTHWQAAADTRLMTRSNSIV